MGATRSFTTHTIGTASLTAEADDYLTWNISAPLRPWYPPPPTPANDDDDADDDNDAFVHYEMLSDGVTGYIGIGEEEIEDMAEQMANALVDLRSQGAAGLIMDMRGEKNTRFWGDIFM